ncbi:MAG: metal-sulfur cluster assembly factor [Ilumatobacter sp.]|uniref:metal-sulfur cluster assembly factor n=1 Tax=Ilumatobacter sp. TaxID=1967498 RepID=UPI00391D9678
MSISRPAVLAALDEVIDPCSSAMGSPIGIRAMGLAHDVAIDDHTRSVRVAMRLTSPCCAYGPTMARAAEERLATIDGVDVAVVEIDHDAVWTPSEMLPSAVTELSVRRRRTETLTSIEPYDWTGWNDARPLLRGREAT